jgi:hypothetical protein
MTEKFTLPRQGIPDQPGSPSETFMMVILCVRNILIGIFSLFFLFWGITLLLSAYNLKNPLEFIMVFFASNFIMLISGCGILFAAFRIWKLYGERRNPS